MDPLCWHELLDRTSVLVDGVSDHLVEHPTFEQLPEEIQLHINAALANLMEAYQLLGAGQPR